MKKLFVIRHGDYNDSLRLSELGKEQMTQVSEKILTRLNGHSMLMLSSTAPRAIDSANAISKVLLIDYEEHEMLWDDDSHWGNLNESIKLINSKKNLADAILVVTHFDFTEELPEHYAKEVLNISSLIGTVGKGEAWEIDFEEPTATHISI